MKYAQVNYLIDTVLPSCKNANAYKVVSIIARETWGRRGCDWVELSYNDLMEKTGIKSVNTLKSAISDAEEYINQQAKEGQGFIYQMKTVSDFDIVKQETLSDIDTVGEGTMSDIDTVPYQKLTQFVSKIDTVQSSSFKEKEYKEGNPIKSLADHFTKETGIFAGLSDWEDGWELPLRTIYDRAKSEDAAKRLLSDAVKFARNGGGKKYTIKNPMSLTTIIANMQVDEKQGTIKVSAR